ncbi:MAG: Trm112 family protein [Candidatus Omnitrophica bacterium]|nr:Trm112 family protein [Candidatus Omnitrophota bacterium]MDE2222660.1 Trm112 family protein [Candidatus Omnitrophota bacterium]
MIDAKLLALLACPACQGDVGLQGEKIVCRQCGRKYPILDGIPVLLVDSAEK